MSDTKSRMSTLNHEQDHAPFRCCLEHSFKWQRLLLYVLVLLVLGGIVAHVAGDAICAAQGIEVSVACDPIGSGYPSVGSVTSSSTLHGGFALPASIAWAGWRILVFLVLFFSFRPSLFSLPPSPPPPRRVI